MNMIKKREKVTSVENKIYHHTSTVTYQMKLNLSEHNRFIKITTVQCHETRQQNNELINYCQPSSFITSDHEQQQQAAPGHLVEVSVITAAHVGSQSLVRTRICIVTPT